MAQQRIRILAVLENAGGIGEQDQFFGLELGGHSGGGGIGIDIEPVPFRVHRQRRNNRHHSGGTKIANQVGIHPGNTSDTAQVNGSATRVRQSQSFAE